MTLPSLLDKNLIYSGKGSGVLHGVDDDIEPCQIDFWFTEWYVFNQLTYFSSTRFNIAGFSSTKTINRCMVQWLQSEPLFVNRISFVDVGVCSTC